MGIVYSLYGDCSSQILISSIPRPHNYPLREVVNEAIE